MGRTMHTKQRIIRASRTRGISYESIVVRSKLSNEFTSTSYTPVFIAAFRVKLDSDAYVLERQRSAENRARRENYVSGILSLMLQRLSYSFGYCYRDVGLMFFSFFKNFDIKF